MKSTKGYLSFPYGKEMSYNNEKNNAMEQTTVYTPDGAS